MATKVTATEFKNRAGRYIDSAGKQPVYITKHDRPVRVLMDVEEYERLKAYDTREAMFVEELDGAAKAAFMSGYKGRATPELDHLMED